MNKTQLLQGTLDLLILRILELGPNHLLLCGNARRRSKYNFDLQSV